MGVDKLKEAKLYICAGIFIALTVIKLVSPELSTSIASEIRDVMRSESAQTQSVVSLGASLTDGTFFDAFKRSESERYVSAGEFETDKKALPPPQESVTPNPQASPEPEITLPTETEAPNNEKVTAFLEEQKQYSDYPLPANVSYDYPDTGFEYTSPVEGATSSGFGYRLHPLKNEIKFHYGTDFAVPEGSEIRAFADGTVIAAGYSDSYGNYIVMTHPNGWRTLYAHCKELCTGCGSVSMGDTIALVGHTGAVTGTHLHFELQCDGIYLNPEFYI